MTPAPCAAGHRGVGKNSERALGQQAAQEVRRSQRQLVCHFPPKRHACARGERNHSQRSRQGRRSVPAAARQQADRPAAHWRAPTAGPADGAASILVRKAGPLGAPGTCCLSGLSPRNQACKSAISSTWRVEPLSVRWPRSAAFSCWRPALLRQAACGSARPKLPCCSLVLQRARQSGCAEYKRKALVVS